MAEDFFTLREGETAAPVPAGPVLCQASAAMRRVHRVFLWAYDEAPGLVRSAAAGDRERSAYVGEVLGNFDKLLHVHHESEDLLMYPKLAARAPAGPASGAPPRGAPALLLPAVGWEYRFQRPQQLARASSSS